MDCPVCKDEAMVVLELDQVEIDHCLNCGGIWLDAGELELLLEDGKEKDELLKSFKADTLSKEKKRKCPICLRAMGKIVCGTEEKVLIDKCRNNDGIWFDKGELDQVIKIGNLDKDNKILFMLKDMFQMRLGPLELPKGANKSP